MLQGRLPEFRLPDIFQLLGFTKKTGLLRITTDATEGQVYFHDGAVSLAVPDTARGQLGARLRHQAPLTDAQLARMLEAQRRADLPALLHELVAEDAVDAATLRDVLHDHITDAVFTLMRLDDGGFSFDTTAGQDAPLVGMPSDELVAEGGRRLVEWERIRARVPSPDTALAMVPSPPRGEAVTLQPDQWRLLALVDGTHTVADLAELTGQGEYATFQVVADLVEAALLEQRTTPPVASTPVHTPFAGLSVAPAPTPDPEPAPAPAPEPEPTPELEPMQSAPEPEPAQPVAQPQPQPVAHARPVAQPAASSPTADPARERLVGLRRRMQEVGLSPVMPTVATVFDEPVADAASPVEETSAVEAAPAADEWTLLESLSQESTVEPAAQEPAVDEPTVEEPAVEEPQDDTPAPPPAAPFADYRNVDRASVARELAALGLDDMPAPAPSRAAAPTPAPAPKPNNGHGSPRRLTRDEDVNKGLLLRLIDGVKGA